MMIGIVSRIELNEEKKTIKRYIPGVFIDIFDELGIVPFTIYSEKDLDKICDMCDALVLPGSPINIDPKYYGENPIDGMKYDIDEYKLDESAIEIFSKKNKPILGICGGCQSINVYYEGSLNQKIENHELDGGLHKINIDDNSFISSIYGESSQVNSYHMQSIKDVAKGFRVTARAEDGTIEAIENDNIIGVQWHPEKVKDMQFFIHFFEMINNKKNVD